ncbi:MAG: 50S ribosomal protein L6, partial [Candidatus Dormibacteraeota bacterium]|nr:50S ribosomal protein L6 [Candidatus Dormibacteraeota bacterium]
MSRIGKLPIAIPSGVKIGVTHNVISVEGPRGQLERAVPQAISVAVEGDQVLCTRPDDSR